MQLVPLKMMAHGGLFCGWPFEKTKVNLQEMEWPDKSRSCVLSKDCWSLLHVPSVFNSPITVPILFALVADWCLALGCSGSQLMLNLMTLLYDLKGGDNKKTKANA
jgi:hypothetical protein